MKKFAIIITVIFVLIAAALAGAAFSYSNTACYQTEKFPAGTSINGVDCSGLSYEQAEKVLSKAWNKKHLVVTAENKNKNTIFTDFGYEYDLKDQLKSAKRSNILAASLNHYLGAPLNISMPMTVAKYDKEFKKEVTSSSCFNVKDSFPSSDAYVDMSDPDFNIVSEIIGTEPDPDAVFEDITAHIEDGKFSFIFDAKKYYSAPEVTSNDPELLAYQKYCREYLTQKITYKMGEETFTISPEKLSSLLKDDMSGKADESAVQKYVADMAAKFNNVGAERHFTSFTGKEITVSGGTYGWTIDQAAEAAQLTTDINSHEDVSREPVYSFSGYGEYARNMGTTYIDVDISQQKVRFFKEGELVFSSDCVSGNKAAGRLTDIGTFYIINKVRNVVLRGYNNDGSEYASPVLYWMGINWSGEGFHDSNWRTEFGGNIWRTNGSHGCVNLPRQNVPEFYNMTEIGTPVVVHY